LTATANAVGWHSPSIRHGWSVAEQSTNIDAVDLGLCCRGYVFLLFGGTGGYLESWEFLPDGIAGFHERYGDDADRQIAIREQAAKDGIPATLAAIKDQSCRRSMIVGV
jgi:hypothetical protein